VNGCRKTIEALDRLIATESQPAALAPPDVALFSFGLCILIAHTHCSMNPLACDHSLPRGMHLLSELQELVCTADTPFLSPWRDSIIDFNISVSRTIFGKVTSSNDCSILLAQFARASYAAFRLGSCW